MKKQTYQNGILIDEIEEIEDNIKTPNWTLFNLSFFSDEAYTRVTLSTTNKQAKNRLEAYCISLGLANNPEVNIEILKILWNQMIDSVPEESTLTLEESSNWNQIISNSNMIFRVDSSGKII